MRNEIYNLEQHFYKLKHQQSFNKMSKTILSQAKQIKPIGKTTKGDKRKTHPEKR